MSRNGRYLFTSESVTEGHPDKIADQISDSILDAILAQDPVGRVACETLVTTGLAIIAGEITTSCYVDFPKIVRDTIRDVGYTRAKFGFDSETCAVLSSIHEQSPDIAMGVDPGGAGEQPTDAGVGPVHLLHGGGGVEGQAAAGALDVGLHEDGGDDLEVAAGGSIDVDLPEGLDRLKQLDEEFGSKLYTQYATVDAIEQHVIGADLVIGAVLVPGAAAPKLVTREMLKRMRPGSVLVDISIDQGGCFETSHPTTHADPTYVVDGIVHYCVANMPGAVARTSTFALNNATLPFAVALANKGYRRACADDVHLRNGLNIHAGKLTYKAVADALKLKYTTAEEALGL